MIDTLAKLISFAMQLFYAAAYFSAKSNITHTRYHDGISNHITMAIFFSERFIQNVRVQNIKFSRCSRNREKR